MVSVAFAVAPATLRAGDAAGTAVATGAAVAPWTGAHALATPATSMKLSRMKLNRISSRIQAVLPAVQHREPAGAVLQPNTARTRTPTAFRADGRPQLASGGLDACYCQGRVRSGFRQVRCAGSCFAPCCAGCARLSPNRPQSEVPTLDVRTRLPIGLLINACAASNAAQASF